MDRRASRKVSSIQNYGSDIDPVSGKDLIIKLNKDSVVTGYQVREWKH